MLSQATASDDPYIGVEDRLFAIGSRRHHYINQHFRELAEQYDGEIRKKDVQVGELGRNNHLELLVGRFLVTVHHQCTTEIFKNGLLPFPAKYVQQNALLNQWLAQRELFELSTVVDPESLGMPFNLLVVHRKSAFGLGEVGEIEFVFPKGRRRLLGFTINELVQRQNEIEAMKPDELVDLHQRIEEFKRSAIL